VEAELEMLACRKTEGGFARRKFEGVSASIGRNLTAEGEFDRRPAVFLKRKFRILLRGGLLVYSGISIIFDVLRCFVCYYAKDAFCHN